MRDPERARVVLMITHAFPPQNVSGAARPGQFHRHLPKYGHEVEVVCPEAPEAPDASDGVHRVPKPGDARGVVLADRLAAIIQRFALPYNERLPWVPHAISHARRILRDRNIDLILSTSPPIATHLAALALKLCCGVAWIADFQDPLWGNPFRTRKLGGVYDAALERCFFRHADCLIANTATVADLWRRRHPSCAKKIHVIPNGFDPDEDLTALPIPPRDHKVVAHIGSLYGGRRPIVFLASIERLIKQGLLGPPGIRVQLLGPLEEQAVQRDKPPFSFLQTLGCLDCPGGVIPQATARQAMAQADYLLLLDLNDRNTDFQVPAKIFEYVRVGRPILAFTSKGSPAELILAQSGVLHSVVYTTDTSSQIDDKVAAFLRLPTDATTPSRWFLSQFSADTHARELASLISELPGRKHAPRALGERF